MRILTRFDSGSISFASPPFRRTASVALAVVVCALHACGGAIQGENGKEKSAAPPEAQKRVLFDGKSLAGWRKTDFYHAGEVKIENGAVVMSAGQSMTGITSAHGGLPRTNYELCYEAMRLSGRDFFAAATFPVGKSYITLVNGGWGGTVTGLSSLDGADASENETTQSYRYQDKTWYRFRVRVTDKVIRAWINDKEIVGVKHQDREVRTRVEVRANQPLGFATWETGGAVRYIEIRPLTADEIKSANMIDED